MARVVLGDELEHIDLATDAPAPPRRRRSWPRRRIAALAVTVALIVALLGPVRTRALETGFRHLERVFLQSQALSAARAEAYALVFRRAAVHDQNRLTVAAAHLFAAEERAQAALQRRLDDEWRVGLDGGLRRLRSALVPVIRRDPPFAGLERARELLESTRRRLGLDPQPGPTVSLRAAIAGDLLALRRYFDGATSTRLVVATDNGLFEVDIDASRTRRLRPDGFVPGEGTELFARDGWILVRHGNGPSLALSPDFQRATPVSNGWTWLSARGDTVWTSSRDDMTDRSEVDSTGRVIRGPFELPRANYQAAAADSGLVLEDVDGDAQFRVWDPARRRTVSRHAGWPLAVHGDLVLRILVAPDGPERADILDIGTGRVVTDVAVDDGLSSAAFSPDGRRLAYAGSNGARVVDVAAGGVRPVRGDVTPPDGGVVWSPSGEFAFFYGGSTITAWKVDAGIPTVLRVSADLGYRITGLVALPA